jgi:hypothetical protein
MYYTISFRAKDFHHNWRPYLIQARVYRKSGNSLTHDCKRAIKRTMPSLVEIRDIQAWPA